VREVLRPGSGYAYYAYHDLSHARGTYANLLAQGEIELIYRLLVYFRPTTVAVTDTPSRQMLEHIVKIALPAATITAGEAEMSIIEGRGDIASTPSKYTYFTDSSNPLATDMTQTFSTGHIFRNPARTLIIRDPGLPKQIFEISF